MSLQSGRYASVRLATTAVEYLGRWEVAIDLDTADATYFGSVWKRSMPMMQGWSGSLEGYVTSATSHQQFTILDGVVEGTKLQDIRFYLQSSSGLFWMPAYSTSMAVQSTDAGAYLSSYRVSASKDGITTISLGVVGYGPLALFNGATSSPVVESTSYTA